MVVRDNECGRCNVDCSKYASGSVASQSDMESSGIHVGEIEAVFSEKVNPEMRSYLRTRLTEKIAN